MNIPQDLNGKRVVVTGACGVVGSWIAAAFAEAGASLCLTDTSEPDLDRLAMNLKGDRFAYAADLRQEAEIEGLAAEIAVRWGTADILVNNAGVYPSGFLLDIDVAEWDRIFDVNLRAPFLLTRALAKQMIAAQARGSIINISSGASRKMRRTVVPYCVSKAALDRLTKGFALELAEFGIRVNAVEPGFIAGSKVSLLTEEHVEATSGSIPLGRPSSAADVGNAVLFLASDAAGYMTGSTLTVDGGNSIGSMAVYQAKKSPL